MIEYEYSIKAKSVEPFIKYCNQEGFEFISKAKENRIVFENDKNIIARITIKKKDDEEICTVDFKNKCCGNETFKIAKESLPLQIKKEDIDVVKNMLEVIEFNQSADNLRTRYIFKKDGVKFEIDEYTRPKMNVIGIEGDKDKVDKIYQSIKENEIIKEFILK